MSQVTEILDGTMPYGSEVLTINNVAYIVNNFTVTPNWTTAEDHTALGGPNRKRWTKGRYTAEGELQLAASNTAYPPYGSTFTYLPPQETSNVTFIVVTVPFSETNDPSAIRSLKLTCESAVGAVTTVTA